MAFVILAFIALFFVIAIASAARRNRRPGGSLSRDDPLNIWTSTGQDDGHHGHGHGHGGWGGGDGGGHHGGGGDFGGGGHHG